MSIGSFILIKNEIPWIESHIQNVVDHLDQMVFLDGNSTDGTLEVLRAAARKHSNVLLVEDMDPKNLQESYQAMSDMALRFLETDWAFFLHPDMWIENPEQLRRIRDLDGTAMSTHMTSYAGEPGKALLRIETGRADRWKNIYRLRNPDLGAHYHGWYGAANEDVYFKVITGNQHVFHALRFENYPYEVVNSGLRVHHFSDVRPYARRLTRMASALINQGCPPALAYEEAEKHPRVTLRNTTRFRLQMCNDPRRLSSCPNP